MFLNFEGNETFEKVAGMSLAANMVLYLRNMYNLDNVTAINMLMLWAALGNILPLVGAFVADAWIGKFKTILYGSFLSLLVNVLCVMLAISGVVYCNNLILNKKNSNDLRFKTLKPKHCLY